ncbi:MAG TPA: hypothetical protein ENK31_09595 [Nannocystis exedens]|nr:hypothetical protein [Nannocystis exedens]
MQAANIAFGQGMSASPLQVAAAFGALANQGEYIQPAIIKRTVDHRGETIYEHTPMPERVVRRGTARTVMKMLESVVHSRHGTGNNAAVPGYRVAGKTSTAQKADAKKGYSDDEYFASFIGALPAKNPRVVILVSVDNPEGGHFGNEVAAPSFSSLGEQVMLHLGVPREDGIAPPKPLLVHTERKGGAAIAEDPSADAPALPGQRPRAERMMLTRGDLPNFVGLGLAAAADLADRNRIELLAVGSGVAIRQEQVGQSRDGDAIVRVHFESAS